MHTSIILSYLAAAAMFFGSGFAAPTADAAPDAVAADAPAESPAPGDVLVPLEVLELEMENLQARDGAELQKRLICQFGGKKACSVKCVALGAIRGGYCNNKQ